MIWRRLQPLPLSIPTEMTPFINDFISAEIIRVVLPLVTTDDTNGVLNERPVPIRYIASSRVLLPAPLSPTIKLKPGSGLISR